MVVNTNFTNDVSFKNTDIEITHKMLTKRIPDTAVISDDLSHTTMTEIYVRKKI